MEALPFYGAFLGRTKLGEYIDHDVKRVRWIVPCEDLRPDQGDLNAAFLGEQRSLDLRRLGKIERDNIKPLFGEPYTVAPFAIGDRKSFARSRQ